VVTPDELDALAAKYEALVRLRRRREALVAQGQVGFDEREGPVRLGEMRALAAQFPGALRELEVHEATALERRAQVVRAAQRGEAAVPGWVELVVELHETLRAGLRVKRWLAETRAAQPFDATTAARCAAAVGPDAAGTAGAAARGHWPIEPSTLVALHRPPGGRLMPFVIARVAARLGVSPHDVEVAIFGNVDPR
jgi:hypothetical protein